MKKLRMLGCFFVVFAAQWAFALTDYYEYRGGQRYYCQLDEVESGCSQIGMNVYCPDPGETCSQIGMGVYCGIDCKQIGMNVYCAKSRRETCEQIGMYVYCGVDCKQIGMNVYCTSGGRADPASRARPE